KTPQINAFGRGCRKRRVQITLDSQANFCRRRHQPRRPPPAKMRPGRPAPAMGPGTTAKNPRISPPPNTVVGMLKDVCASGRAVVNAGSAVATEPPKNAFPRLYVVGSVRLKVWS